MKTKLLKISMAIVCIIILASCTNSVIDREPELKPNDSITVLTKNIKN